MNKKYLRIFIITILVLLVFGSFYFLVKFIKEQNALLDETCEHGYGLTKLKIKVLDFQTNRPIDSIRLKIKAGLSNETFCQLDTKQTDWIIYDFTISQELDCEPFWLEVENDFYCDDIIIKESFIDIGIKKGELNEKILFLKPKTKVTIQFIDKFKVFTTDTIYLNLNRKDNKESVWETGYTKTDFKRKKSSVEYICLEPNVEYKATWIQKNGNVADTTFNSFSIKSNENLKLNYYTKLVK